MNLKDICLQRDTRKTIAMESFWLTQKRLLPFCPAIWQEDLCIITVTKGSCEVIADGERHQLCEQDIAVFPPFCLHTLLNYQNFEAQCCFINLRAFSHAKNNLVYLASSHIVKVVPRDTESYPLVSRALLQIAQDRNHEHMLLIDVQNLLHLLHSNANRAKNITNDKQIFAMKNALNLLHTQKSQVVVKQISDLCGYSEFYLMKLFKKFVGCPLVDYAINYRLTLIAQEICQTDKDFCLLAQEHGFANVSYFNRQFKKLFGMTPKQFKKST